jgi:hypothetical protein
MMHFRIQSSPWNGDIECALFHKTGQDIAVVEPLSFRNIERGYRISEPTFRMSYDEAQMLMDELYRAGLRPTEARSSAGQLQAMENHLNDMRRLVFEQFTKPVYSGSTVNEVMLGAP